MLKQALTLLLLLFHWSGLWGQEKLVVTNLKTGKTWSFNKNSKINFMRTQDMDYTRSTLHAFIDSSVVLGKDTVKLSDIISIQKRSPLHKAARIAGMPFMLVGCIFMGDGAAGMVANNDISKGSTLFLLGAASFIIGYTPYLIGFDELMIINKEEWKIELVK